MKHWLLHLYPRAWRARYGDEFLALLDQHPLTITALCDVLFAAWDAHRNPRLYQFAGGSPMESVVTTTRLHPRTYLLTAGVLALFALFLYAAGFLISGVTEDQAEGMLFMGIFVQSAAATAVHLASRPYARSLSNRLFVALGVFFIIWIISGLLGAAFGNWISGMLLVVGICFWNTVNAWLGLKARVLHPIVAVTGIVAGISWALWMGLSMSQTFYGNIVPDSALWTFVSVLMIVSIIAGSGWMIGLAINGFVARPVVQAQIVPQP
jgi:hypothetical protein